MSEKAIEPAAATPTPQFVDPGWEPSGSVGPDPTPTPPKGGKPIPPPDNRPSKWNMDWDFGDGYTMSRHEDGSVTLKDSDGKVGKWDPDSKVWREPDDTLMSNEWAGGHMPTDWDPPKPNAN